jgi:AcrR family transcriptional regulator
MPTLTREERRAQTRGELVHAAGDLFCANGFHSTSLDAVAEAAGYTKGAVYSNFESKEDLFFSVYEQRVEQRTGEMRRIAEAAGSGRGALDDLISSADPVEDGWIAVFFEFWAHVLRHPELRERFAALHRRGLEPFVEVTRRLAREEGGEPPLHPDALATAQLALGTGLQLERLTRPDEIDKDLLRQASLLLGRLEDER